MIALAHLALLWSLHHNLVYLHDLTTDSQTAEKQIISRWHLISTNTELQKSHCNSACMNLYSETELKSHGEYAPQTWYI